jgi:hypothetical protein
MLFTIRSLGIPRFCLAVSSNETPVTWNFIWSYTHHFL